MITTARFGPGFWVDHARTLIMDPEIAIIEVIANCWDAGADRVDIAWPDKYSGPMSVKDNGTGMSYDEFKIRWSELNYNRAEMQGSEVVFPPDNQKSRRKAFGRNGKGRHSLFCFDTEYFVETWQGGRGYRFKVTKQTGEQPFFITEEDSFERDGHGTEISCTASLNYIPTTKLQDLIGSKFVTDPDLLPEN